MSTPEKGIAFSICAQESLRLTDESVEQVDWHQGQRFNVRYYDGKSHFSGWMSGMVVGGPGLRKRS